MTAQQIMQYTGEATFVLLIIILMARPIHKYGRIKWFMRYRRQLGWLTSFMVLSHLGYWLWEYFSWPVLRSLVTSLWGLAGLFGAALLLTLGAISNNYSVKKLGKKWKIIQKYGLYLTIPLVILHAHLAIRGFDTEIILWSIPFIILLSWRIIPKELWFIPGCCLIGLALFYWDLNNTSDFVIPTTAAEIEELEAQGFFIDALGELQISCEEALPGSISCGYPVYYPDGTRVDK